MADRSAHMAALAEHLDDLAANNPQLTPEQWQRFFAFLQKLLPIIVGFIPTA